MNITEALSLALQIASVDYPRSWEEGAWRVLKVDHSGYEAGGFYQDSHSYAWYVRIKKQKYTNGSVIDTAEYDVYSEGEYHEIEAKT